MADNYEVTKQREVIDLDAQGGAVRSQEIEFKSIPSGTIATVRIPLAEFSAAVAQQVLADRAAEIEAVHAL